MFDVVDDCGTVGSTASSNGAVGVGRPWIATNPRLQLGGPRRLAILPAVVAITL